MKTKTKIIAAVAAVLLGLGVSVVSAVPADAGNSLRSSR